MWCSFILLVKNVVCLIACASVIPYNITSNFVLWHVRFDCSPNTISDFPLAAIKPRAALSRFTVVSPVTASVVAAGCFYFLLRK